MNDLQKTKEEISKYSSKALFYIFTESEDKFL